MLAFLLAAATATAPVPAMSTDWWSDYYDTPSQGLAPGEMSLVMVEITVNKYGGFDGCTGHAYSGNPQMGAYVCTRLKKRAVFKPARGPDGQKVVGVFRKLILVANVRSETRFKLPDFPIRVDATSSTQGDNPFEIQFYVGPTGQVSNCSLVDEVDIHLLKHKQVVDPAIVAKACSEVPVQLRPLPPRDKHGDAVASSQSALVIFNGPVNFNNM